MLKFKVDGQHLTVENAVTAADSVNFIRAIFDFSPDWDGYTKTVTFRQGIHTLKKTLTNNMLTAASGVNLTDGVWAVSVVGIMGDSTATTDVVNITVNKSGIGGGQPFNVTASEATQILAQNADAILAVQNRNNALVEAVGGFSFTINFSDDLKNYDLKDFPVIAGKTYILSKDSPSDYKVRAFVYGHTATEDLIVLTDPGKGYAYVAPYDGYMRFFDYSGYKQPTKITVKLGSGLRDDVDALQTGLADTIKNTVTHNPTMISNDDRAISYFGNDYDNLPINSYVCIGYTSTTALNKPYPAFAGNVLTMCYLNYATANGVQQIAFDIDGTISFRIKWTAAKVWTKWQRYDAGTFIYNVNKTNKLIPLLISLGTCAADSSGKGVYTGDTRNKVIYIAGGEYDLYQEYIDAGIPIPASGHSTSDYFGFNAFVPPNTKIIGLGQVTLKFEPTKAQLVALGGSEEAAKTVSDIWCPINIAGAVEMENVTIKARNCRYCIHDDMHASDVGTQHTFRNVTCIMGEPESYGASGIMGFAHATGMGWSPRTIHKYIDCIFENQSSVSFKRAFYGHGYTDVQAGSAYKAEDGATVELTNCVINKSAGSGDRCISLQTLAGSTAAGKVNPVEHLRVNMRGCWTNCSVLIDTSNDGAHNTIDLTVAKTTFDIGDLERYKFVSKEASHYPVREYGNV